MKSEKGFTLIELLVVVAIIGLLAAIAIPMFAEYKTRSFNSRALSDLRSVLTAEEAYYAVNETYLECGSISGTLCEGNLPGLTSLSSGVLISMTMDSIVVIAMVEGGESNLIGAACHMKGDSVYSFNAGQGGSSIVERIIDGGSTCAASVVGPGGGDGGDGRDLA